MHLCFCAQQNSQNNIKTVTPFCFKYAVDHSLCLIRHIHFPILPVAVATVITGCTGLLPEIGENIIPQASGSPAVALHHLKAFGVPLPDQLNILRFHPGKMTRVTPGSIKAGT